MVYHGENLLIPVSFPTEPVYLISILRSNHCCKTWYFELALKKLFRPWLNTTQVAESIRCAGWSKECHPPGSPHMAAQWNTDKFLFTRIQAEAKSLSQHFFHYPMSSMALLQDNENPSTGHQPLYGPANMYPIPCRQLRRCWHLAAEQTGREPRNDATSFKTQGKAHHIELAPDDSPFSQRRRELLHQRELPGNHGLMLPKENQTDAYVTLGWPSLPFLTGVIFPTVQRWAWGWSGWK